jgi:uncharacterized membrane protein
VNRRAAVVGVYEHASRVATGDLLFVVAVVLILGGPFITRVVLRRHPDKATSGRFLSYRWASFTAGVCAVVLVVLLVRNGGFH